MKARYGFQTVVGFKTTVRTLCNNIIDLKDSWLWYVLAVLVRVLCEEISSAMGFPDDNIIRTPELIERYDGKVETNVESRKMLIY